MEQHIKIEKRKARELRKSNWWLRKKQNAICYYCQSTIEEADVTMDHIIPLSRWGKSIKSNLVPACKACNNEKKNKDLFDWTLNGV